MIGIEEYYVLKENVENDKDLQLFTGAKKYTGGASGSGHSWLLTGVDKYEEIRKKLVLEIDIFKNVFFECKTKENEIVGLTEMLYSANSDYIETNFYTENRIDDLLASSLFAQV